MEINFLMNCLLQLVATDFLFSENDIFSFRFFWKPLLQLEGDQYLKKVLFMLEEPFSSIFFSDTDSNGSNFSEQWNFSTNLSFWLVETEFRLLTQFLILFGAFFGWWA